MIEDKIIVKDVSKKFNLDIKDNSRALKKFVSLFSGSTKKKELLALNNINFNVKAGENLGIIGKNGSGKSTLLRVIAGIYNPSSGEVLANGDVIYLAGFHEGVNNNLTMRENIYLRGSVLGLSQKNIRKKFDEIVEFSGLKDFVDTKVFQFSKGMVLRLNFSISVHCIQHSKPEILLLDEIFGGVGDIDFEAKAIKKLEELISGGTTVILSSHDLSTIKKYCDRVILLDKGEIIKEGNPAEIIDFYKSGKS